VTRICRTCGALLPISTRSSRTKKTKPKEEKKEKKKKPIPTTQKKEEPIISENQKKEKLELQEIPIADQKVENFSNLDEIPSETSVNVESETLVDIPSKKEENLEEEKPTLQEITPKPFQGTILSAKQEFSPLVSKSEDVISDAFSELKKSVLDVEVKKPKPKLSPLPQKTSDPNAAILKQKKLEKDMSEVLGFLSKKIAVKKIEKTEKKSPSADLPVSKLPPTSMNEILKELITLDSRIEASAIIKTDGTMLASAISSRISESLFGTIGINLSMISSDIIEGLSAGTLKSISLKGTEGILDLAFLDLENSNLSDMILILFSHPQVKSGIISIAVNLIKKQVKHYLGLEK
jgi:predicted regulator of Ras-like GTPase activity (Roadblock/LC7/MglB family)